MSERQEHLRRLNLKIKFASDFYSWLDSEPPMWKFFSWYRWRSSRPNF